MWRSFAVVHLAGPGRISWGRHEGATVAHFDGELERQHACRASIRGSTGEVGQRYSDFNACQEQADIHQGLLVRSGERLFSPQLFFSTFQKWHSKFATHRQAAGLQCSTLGIVAPGKATTDLKPRATASYPNRESTKPSSAITRKKKSRAAA
jgi:hypothetical protein